MVSGSMGLPLLFTGLLVAEVAAAIVPTSWKQIVNVGTAECLDTGCDGQGCESRIDQYACDNDGHNERFAYDNNRLLVGPGNNGPGGTSRPGWCVQGVKSTKNTDAIGQSSIQTRCDSSNDLQYFKYINSTLRSKDTTLCFTATSSGADSSKCAPAAVYISTEQGAAMDNQVATTDTAIPPSFPNTATNAPNTTCANTATNVTTDKAALASRLLNSAH
jgi:hypothetical protein